MNITNLVGREISIVVVLCQSEGHVRSFVLRLLGILLSVEDGMFVVRHGKVFKTLITQVSKMSCITPDEYTQVVRKGDVIDFCARCVEKVGISHEHSRELGEVLVAGDYRGHYSHGINRLGMLVA